MDPLPGPTKLLFSKAQAASAAAGGFLTSAMFCCLISELETFNLFHSD